MAVKQNTHKMALYSNNGWREGYNYSYESFLTAEQTKNNSTELAVNLCQQLREYITNFVPLEDPKLFCTKMIRISSVFCSQIRHVPYRFEQCEQPGGELMRAFKSPKI